MNEQFAPLIIDHLIKLGVRKFCIAPGARSTPLVNALIKHEDVQALVHFDERGCGFHAFGYSKGSKAPAALIVTSGTALGNLYPAIMEAFQERVPLIILSADRPPELRDCGANQACDQVKFFGEYVQWHFEIPCYSPEFSHDFIGSIISQAVYRATKSPQGPVHLNCMFREPFLSDLREKSVGHTIYEHSYLVPSKTTLDKIAKTISHATKGVIVIGSLPQGHSLKSIYDLSEKLEWPIIPDILSGARSDALHPNIISYYEAIFKNSKSLKPNCILHLGDRMVSKSFLDWAKEIKQDSYITVTNHPYRQDYGSRVTHRVECDPSVFCELLAPLVKRQPSWLGAWRTQSDSLALKFRDLMQESQITQIPNEVNLIYFLQNHLHPNWALFVANSMPIRDTDAFFFPKFFRGPIFGKRGLSGIDGNIATAIGVAEGAERPTLALLGDLSALHDINSLAQIHQAQHPVIFLIVNNQGGGIFSFLPFKENTPQFEKYFAGSHNFRFEHAARMFHIPFHSVNNLAVLGSILKEEKSCIVEINTNREENHLLHQMINKGLKECVESFSYTDS